MEAAASDSRNHLHNHCRHACRAELYIIVLIDEKQKEDMLISAYPLYY